MSFLLDTCVVSEVVRRQPNAKIIAWLESTPNDALHLSVLTLGELRQGVEKLPSGSKRERLRNWLEQELPAWFESRLLPIDSETADQWGRLTAAAGRSVPAIDSLLAASALTHGLRLVTRNVSDFAFPGLELVDPWTGAP